MRGQESVGVEKFQNFEAMAQHYRRIGEQNSKKWAEVVNTATQAAFTQSGVSSVSEFAERRIALSESSKMVIDTIPFGENRAAVDIDLMPNICVFDDNNAHDRLTFNQSAPDNVIEFVDETNVDTAKNLPIGVVWQGSLASYPHLGLWTYPGRKEGFAQALYTFHESLFGRMGREAAASVEMIKFYLSLGFEPAEVIEPTTRTQMQNINPKQFCVDAVNKEIHSLPLVVRFIKSQENFG